MTVANVFFMREPGAEDKFLATREDARFLQGQDLPAECRLNQVDEVRDYLSSHGIQAEFYDFVGR